jgi:hypothetical protein
MTPSCNSGIRRIRSPYPNPLPRCPRNPQFARARAPRRRPAQRHTGVERSDPAEHLELAVLLREHHRLLHARHLQAHAAARVVGQPALDVELQGARVPDGEEGRGLEGRERGGAGGPGGAPAQGTRGEAVACRRGPGFFVWLEDDRVDEVERGEEMRVKCCGESTGKVTDINFVLDVGLELSLRCASAKRVPDSN